jgi:hypothetical protein
MGLCMLANIRFGSRRRAALPKIAILTGATEPSPLRKGPRLARGTLQAAYATQYR